MNEDTRSRANSMAPLLLGAMLALIPGCAGDGPADTPASEPGAEPQAKTLPIPGGTVMLKGQTAGGPLTALDTTSGHAEDLGLFEFMGIPEGDYQLTAGVAGTPRRAGAEVSLTATAPVVMADLVLEPAGDVAFRIFESLVAGLGEVDLGATLLDEESLELFDNEASTLSCEGLRSQIGRHRSDRPLPALAGNSGTLNTAEKGGFR